MTRYGIPTTYGDYAYGTSSVPSISVTPFTANVINYNNVVVTWVNPVIPLVDDVPDIHRFRLLRNQDGIPDSAEDGTILVETLDSVPTFDTFTDQGKDYLGNDAPFKIGHRVYYTIWLHLGSAYAHRWVLAAVAMSVIPDDHSVTIDAERKTPTTHERFLDILPRVFTSSEQNMVDEVNYDSDLSKFLSAMSFTFDELMTLADLLLPDSTYQHLPPELLNAKAYGYNIPKENRPSTKYTRKLVRDAIVNYSAKGTPTSLLAFIEDLTGYSPRLIETSNLFLSPEDATFYKGIGNWKSIGDVDIVSSLEIVPPTGTAEEEARRVDFEYTGKVTSGSSNVQITNGMVSPITEGIPVIGGTDYSFYFYCLSNDEIDITPTVHWYDYLGNLISSVSGDSVSGSSSWVKNSLSISTVNSITSPDNAVYAATSFSFSGPATVYFDMMQFGFSKYTDVMEARAVGVRLTPQKKNLIKNPSFEVDTAGWAATNATLSAVALPSLIPGTRTGSDGLLVESGVGDDVTVTVTSDESFLESSDLVFSTYIYSSEDSADNFYTAQIEAYTVEPYSNFISDAVSLPTNGSSWIDSPSDGTWTATDLTTGGPTATGGKHREYEITDDPTTGVLAVGIDSADIVPANPYGGDAEYVFRMWVKSSIDASFYPEVTWWVNDTAEPEVAGDTVYLDADVWTQIEFTTLSPVNVTDMRVSINSAVADNYWDIGDTVSFAGAEVGYYTVISDVVTWNQVKDTWTRNSCHVSLPQLRIPYDKDAASFDVRVSYASSGADVYFDGAMVEERYTPSDYFDGSTVYAEWAGTANASVSYLFVNKSEKLARLWTEIRKYIPIGIPFYVESQDGVEFGGLFKGYA